MARPEAEAHVVVETVAKCMFLVVGVGGGLSRRWLLRLLDGSCWCWMDWMGWAGWAGSALAGGSEAQIHQCLCLTPNTSFRAYPRPQRRPLTKVPQQVFRRFRSLANTLACESLTDGRAAARLTTRSALLSLDSQT